MKILRIGLNVLFLLFSAWLHGQTASFSWVQTTGGSSNDQGTNVITDAQGNVYVTGHFRDTIDLNGSAPGGILAPVDQADVFLAKFDSSGQLLHVLPLSGQGNQFAASLNLDSSGRIVITGEFDEYVDFDPGPANAYLYPTGFTNIFFACYDTALNYQWAKRIGGNFLSRPNDLAIDPNGDILLLGTFFNTCDFDPSPAVVNLTSSFNTMFIGRYDANGNYLNVISFYDSIVGASIDVSAQSEIFVAGQFTGVADFDPSPLDSVNLIASVSLTDVFIAKYTSAGNYIWAKQINGPGSEYATSLKKGPAGIYVSGYFNDTVDFDPGPGIHMGDGSGINAFVGCYDTSGALVWVNTMGYTGTDQIFSLDIAPDGAVCVAGRFYMMCDVDPSVAVVNLNALQYAFFAVGYDPGSGDYLWSIAPENSTESGAQEISVSKTGAILLTGQFSYAIDFDPDTGSANAFSQPFSDDIFAAKYLLNQLNGISEFSEPEVQIYPNPTTGNLVVAPGKMFSEVNVKVCDAEGRCISTRNYFNSPQIEINIEGDPGTYFISLQSDGHPIRTIRVIKCD